MFSPPTASTRAPHPARVCLLGATGTIGRATAEVLCERGHEVVCLIRPVMALRAMADAKHFGGAQLRVAEVTDPESLVRDGFRGERFDALISCLASRTGAAQDAWAVDYQAHVNALRAAQQAQVGHFVLLSALCVQKPLLAFQHAKLAFEQALKESGLPYTIVRPTAFFKSLCGQIERVRRGRPFMLFGDGTLTSCKPLSDSDLAAFLADCVQLEERRNCVLPIGGPGQAVTPRQQGERLFALLNRRPRFQHIPTRMFDVLIRGLSTLGRVSPKARDKAELARIGRYYATESMLVWDAVRGRYDAEATPATGTQSLFDFYERVIRGEVEIPSRGDHAVF